MLIKTKFIDCASKNVFNSWKLPTSASDTSGDIYWSAMVFIRETGEIWTHGKLIGGFYSNADNDKVSLSIGGVEKILSVSGHKQPYSSLTGSGSINNQALLSTGVPNDWKLVTLGKNAFSNEDYLLVDGIAVAAEKVVNALTFRYNGNAIHSFDGSIARIINILQGDNVFITGDSQGNITIAADPGSDTVNTAGATNLVDRKIFLIGAESQTTSPQTYSNENVYVGTDNCLYSNKKKVLTDHQDIYGLDIQTLVGAITTKVTTYNPRISKDTFTLVQGPNITLIPDVANNRITITSKDTTYDFYNLVFKQDNTIIDTYRPTTSPNKIVSSGENVTFTGTPDEIIISSKDTRNTVGATKKLATKLFLVGSVSQTDNPQSYSNDKVYIGTDNKLYSDDKIVSTVDHTHLYAGSLTAGGAALKLDLNPNGLLEATYGTYGGIIQDSISGPIDGTWYNKLKILHNNSLGYYTELAQSVTGIEGLWHRRNLAGIISEWKAILDTSNFRSHLDDTYIRKETDPNQLTNFVRYSQSTGLTMNWSMGNVTPTHIWGHKGGDSANAYTFNGAEIRVFANAVNKSGDTMTGSLTALSFIKSGSGSHQLLRGDGGVASFNWKYITGQPTYIWGGNSQHSYSVYNPSEFRVANAETLTGFTSGKSDKGEHNADNCTINGLYYATSNYPSGMVTTDGALYVQARNDSWVAQIAQDYRNGDLQVRGKNNGIWQPWYKVLTERTYSSIADARYVKKTGDTMTGALIFQNTQLSSTGNWLNVKTNYGNSQFGMNNSGYLHIYTDAPAIAFNKSDIQANGNKMWHAGNDGSGSTLDADLLDGYHGSDYLRSFWSGADANIIPGTSQVTFTYANNAPFNGILADFSIRQYGVQFNTSYDSNTQLAYRRHAPSSDGGTGTWQYLARTTDNVASATRLQNARNIWGQSFDGTGNVDGRISINSYGVSGSIGAQNTSWFHFYTSRPILHDKSLYVIGDYYGGSSYNRRLAYVDEILSQVGGTKSAQMNWPSWSTSTSGGAIQIRETNYVSSGQSAWGYSPAISFNWGNRYTKRFGLRSDGQFAVDNVPISLSDHVHGNAYASVGFNIYTGSGNSTSNFQTWINSMYNNGGYKGQGSITVGTWHWASALSYNSTVGSINPSGSMIIYGGDGSSSQNYKHFLILDAYGNLFGLSSTESSWKYHSKFVRTTDTIENANKANVAAKLGRGGDINSPMTFHWSGQSGQPTWLWGGNDGTNTWLYNPSNFSVNYAKSSGATNAFNITDNRGADRAPSYYPTYQLSTFFNNSVPGTVQGGWHSGITVKGWHEGYAGWQLFSYSDIYSPKNELFFRTGINSSWNSTARIWHSQNLDVSYLVPRGTIIMYLGSDTPAGWIDITSQFAGRFPCGVGTMYYNGWNSSYPTSFQTSVGGTGGSSVATIYGTSLPKHSHRFVNGTNNYYGGTYTEGSGASDEFYKVANLNGNHGRGHDSGETTWQAIFRTGSNCSSNYGSAVYNSASYLTLIPTFKSVRFLQKS